MKKFNERMRAHPAIMPSAKGKRLIDNDEVNDEPADESTGNGTDTLNTPLKFTGNPFIHTLKQIV